MTGRSRMALGALLAGVALGVGAPAAVALTCPPYEDVSPASVARGIEQMDGRRFLDVYDAAILGTVVASRTTPDPDVRGRERTEVLLEVTGTFGPSLPSTTLVVFDGVGWVSDPFTVGRHYFVPVSLKERDHPFVGPCTQVTQVGEAMVPNLVATARQHAWGEQARLGGDEQAEPMAFAADPEPTATVLGVPWWWVAAAAAAVGGSGMVRLAVARRRHPRTRV